MRRPFVQLAVVGLLLAASVLVPASAQARPLVQAAAGSCPHPQSYPPAPNATVQSSATNVHAGEKINVSGIRYCPNEDVVITISGQHVGSAHTDSAGSFGPDLVVVPGARESAPLCGIGASGLANDRDCLTLHFREVAGQGASSTPVAGSSGGGTAFTGVEIASLIAVAAALLGIGIAFATAGRRKSAARG